MSNQNNFTKFILEHLKNDDSKDYSIAISKKKGLHFANTIKNAIMKNKKIFVYGDYDVDGILSSTQMIEVIKDFGKINDRRVKLDFRIPSRAEHYGLKYDFFKKAIDGYDLFITCDNGTHKDFFSKLSEKDKEKLLIIDHHPNGDFTNEKNVINPNIDGRISISTGILVDFIHQCLRLTDSTYAKQRDSNYYKDLTAITLISDMANSNNKTVRAFIKKGLEKISEKKRPVYKHFFPEWKKDINVEDIAFNLIPKLNSVGRLGLELDWVVDLFSANKETDFVKESILILEDTNEQRKDAQNYFTELIEKDMKNSGLDLESASLLYFHNSEVPIGLNGLIAGSIAQKFKTNAIFTSINYGGDEKAVGSGRGDNIKGEMRAIATEFPEVSESIHFGGHEKAIGLRTANPELLMRKTIEYNKKHKKQIMTSGKHLICDKAININEYLEQCEIYHNICGSIPLNDSFFVPVTLLILGYDEYRNNFVKLICQDKKGDFIEIITKNTAELNLLSEDFINMALEIKSTTNNDDINLIFTDVLSPKTFSNQNDVTIKEIKETCKSKELEAESESKKVSF